MCRIKLKIQKNLYIGNLNAKRDWGHAKDYAEMQWLMLQQKNPEDFVIATGEQHSVKDFINHAAQELKMNIKWQGNGKNEVGIYKSREIIKIDPKYFRLTEIDSLVGDSTKAKKKLGWRPKISFKRLVKEMVAEDLKIAKKEIFFQKK